MIMFAFRNYAVRHIQEIHLNASCLNMLSKKSVQFLHQTLVVCHRQCSSAENSSSFTKLTSQNEFDFDTSKISVDGIKEEFSKMGGGDISLVKDSTTGIAKLQLVNKRMRNAYSGKMMCDLNDAVIELENWNEGKGLIIHSDDPTFFSSGVDTNFIKSQQTYEGGYKMATLMHDTMWRLTFLPYITVSLVQGRALGGGAEICTATDFRVFSPSGSLTFIQAKVGLVSNYSGSRLVKLIGQKEALKLLLSCRTVGSKEAADLGLCDLITYGEGDRSTSETVLWLEENFLNHAHIDVIKSMKGICQQSNFSQSIEENLRKEKLEFTSRWGGDPFLKATNKNNRH